MSGFDPNRREALKRMALLGAAGLVPGILPVRSAHAADLTAGFVYIGPRLDWGWNQSHAVAAAGLKGVPNVRVVQADYFRRAPTTVVGRRLRKPEPTPRRWKAWSRTIVPA
jgi:basic membrane protein A and related proteins